MTFAQNMQLVGKGQEIAQNSSDDPCCLGLASGRKARLLLWGLMDLALVPRQLRDLGGLLKLRGYVLTFLLLKLSLICLSPGLLLGPGNKYIPFQLCYIIIVVSY